MVKEKLNRKPPVNNWNCVRNVRMVGGCLWGCSALVVVVHVCWQAVSLLKEVRLIIRIGNSGRGLRAVQLWEQESLR